MIGDRWGVTDDEVYRHYPCDDWLGEARLQAWRGVTVDREPGEVWPWVAQIRLAPYSYDWIDNLGRPSPRQLRGLDDPAPGERFTTAGVAHLGRILSVDPGRQLTGTIAGTVISYVLVPHQRGQTRLLMKLVAGRRWWPLAPVLVVGDLVMARRQLLNLKRFAESAG